MNLRFASPLARLFTSSSPFLKYLVFTTYYSTIEVRKDTKMCKAIHFPYQRQYANEIFLPHPCDCLPSKFERARASSNARNCAHTLVRTRLRKYASTLTPIPARAHACTHTQLRDHADALMQADTRSCRRARTHTCTHAHAHTFTHARAHTHISGESSE